MRAARLLLSGVAAVCTLAGTGVACSDDCQGTADCGSAVEVSWSPDDLGASGLVRLCVAGTCNAATAPYVNPVTGDLHAPPWDEALPDEPVDVELQLLDLDGTVIEAFETIAAAKERCSCRNLRLTVDDGLLTPGV